MFYNDLFELFKDEAFTNLHEYAPDEIKILVKLLSYMM